MGFSVGSLLKKLHVYGVLAMGVRGVRNIHTAPWMSAFYYSQGQAHVLDEEEVPFSRRCSIRLTSRPLQHGVYKSQSGRLAALSQGPRGYYLSISPREAWTRHLAPCLEFCSGGCGYQPERNIAGI